MNVYDPLQETAGGSNIQARRCKALGKLAQRLPACSAADRRKAKAVNLVCASLPYTT
mgnify:CR=1 FL=1